MALEEAYRLLPSLAHPLAVAGEPGARLLHQGGIDRGVEHTAPVGDALVVEDVELSRLERWCDLVLDHLDLDPVAGHVQPTLDGVDFADVEPDRGIELERPATGRHLGVAEHDANLLPQLVDEDHRGARLRDGAGQFAQRLRHQPRLQGDVAIPHLAVDLRLRYQRRHRVDDDDVDSAGTDQHVDNFERLLARVRLRNQQVLGLDADVAGVDRIQGMLGIDKGRDATQLLRLGDDV